MNDPIALTPGHHLKSLNGIILLTCGHHHTYTNCIYRNSRLTTHTASVVAAVRVFFAQAEALEVERAATEVFLRPLRLQLSDLEEQVAGGTIAVRMEA